MLYPVTLNPTQLKVLFKDVSVAKPRSSRTSSIGAMCVGMGWRLVDWRLGY